jgi:hypothetical protein
MKIGSTYQHYAFIHTQRVDEQTRIQHQQNLKNLQRMNRETVESVEKQRETQRMENAKWDRVRQAQEAHLGSYQKDGHNETMNHVDIKV